MFFAGQMTGVEGYVESAASGMLAGINMAHVLKGEEPVVLGVNTMMGAMAHYITHADPNHFQPMNANFGIMHLEGEVKKKDRKAAYAPQALKIIQELKEKNGPVSYTHLFCKEIKSCEEFQLMVSFNGTCSASLFR